MCVRQHGDAPEVTLHGRLDLTFAYVAEHVHYILLELLKNSMRCVRGVVVLLLAWCRPAVHSTHPPIKNKKTAPRWSSTARTRCRPSGSSSRTGRTTRTSSSRFIRAFCIHTYIERDHRPSILSDDPFHHHQHQPPQVSDEGGGIPRSHIMRIWSYLFTTADPAIQQVRPSLPPTPSNPPSPLTNTTHTTIHHNTPQGLRGLEPPGLGLRHRLAARRARVRPPHQPRVRPLLWRGPLHHVDGGLRHGRVRAPEPPRHPRRAAAVAGRGPCRRGGGGGGSAREKVISR